MSRSVTADYYQEHRFRLVFGRFITGSFKSVTVPEVSVSEETYKSGEDLYPKKQPGIAEVGDLAVERGIVYNDSELMPAILAAIGGSPAPEYRFDVHLYEYHLSDLVGTDEDVALVNVAPSRITTMHNCWVKSAKPTADKNGDSGAIALETMTFSCERIEVEFINQRELV